MWGAVISQGHLVKPGFTIWGAKMTEDMPSDLADNFDTWLFSHICIKYNHN